MDISDERRKKLEAGKEKLAAFRKKKAKVKKTVKDNGEGLNPKDTVEPIKEDATCLPDNDHFYMTNGAELSEEAYSKTPIHKETNFPDTQQQTLGPEEVAEEAPIIPESIIGEAQQSFCDEISQLNTNSNCEVKFDEYEDTDLSPDVESSDLEKALTQRDRLIEELANSLKSNANQQAEKEDLTSQVLNLAQHVTQLQSQLKEADQTLQEQLQFHGISTSAIQSAKNQMLQLQSIVHAKDEELLLASQQLEKNNESLCHSKEENAKLSQRLEEKSEELNSLQSCYDVAVSSQVEKQEREESEKSSQLSELQNQWSAKEGEMKESLVNQAKEIENWRKCEREWKEKEDRLKRNYEDLSNRLQQESGKEERLEALESELEALRRLNEASVEESTDLRKKNEEQNNNYKSCLSNLEALTGQHNQLSSVHSNMVDDFESLKSKNSGLEESLKQLTLANETMKSELEALSSKLVEEQDKLESSDEHRAELASKHNMDCDQLNNKIYELQGSLSITHESLAAAENALVEEKEAMNALQQEVLAKESSLAVVSDELSDLSSRHSDLQSQLLSKEDQIKHLENMLSEKSSTEVTLKDKEVDLEQDKVKLEENVAGLTKEVDELKNQCEKFAEMFAQQQSENVLAVNKIKDLNNELEKKDGNLAHENEKFGMIEVQLESVEEQRKGLNQTIEVLNGEICALKEDLKNERLQTDILGEELILVNSKLVETENVVQHKLLEMKEAEIERRAEAEQYRSEISELEKDAERVSSMSDEVDLKLKSSAQDLETMNDNLVKSEESLKEKTKDHQALKEEMKNVKEREEKSAFKIKQLEDELKDLKMENEAMVEKEKENLQNQEEMQGQLETTVNQWQKLQLIVQEKEIELQNLHDDLDEQKRICTTLGKNHEENLNSVNSDLNSLKEAKEKYEVRVQELEVMLSSHQNSLYAKDAEVSDTMTKIQTMDSSIQDLTLQLSEREKDLDFSNSEKERVSIELSIKLKEIENLEEDLSKAKNEIACLDEDLSKTKVKLSNTESSLEVEKKEKESLLKDAENKDLLLSDKQRELASQIENMQVEIEEAQKHSIEATAEINRLELLIPDLESACSEKDELLSKERTTVTELENLLDKERQQRDRLHGSLSSLMQDVEAKEEYLVMNSALLEDKVSEAFEKDEALSKSLQNIETVQEDLKTARTEIERLETNLESTNNEKESLMSELELKNMQLNEVSASKNELDLQIKMLNDKLVKTENEGGKLSTETDNLNSQVSLLQASCDDKEKLLAEEQDKVAHLTNKLDEERRRCIRLNGLLSSLSEELGDKESALLQHGVLLDERLAELSQIETELKEKENVIRDMENNNIKMVTKMEELEIQADKKDHDTTELTQMNKELCERVSQLEQEVKKKEGDVFELKQDNEIILKECSDLRADIQENESKNLSLVDEIDLMKSALAKSSDEKEMLKNNFDACLGEMQQKLSAQEIESNRWRSQVAEESRNNHESQDELKELYIQQLAQVEDRLAAVEKEKAQVEKEVEDERTKMEAMKDYYEHQISELDLSVQAAQSEAVKMKDVVSKINMNHENELKDLKSLHELQTSELMENYLSLEKSMVELQKTLNDQAENMKQERNEMEQSFENLMAEMDEKKRRSDTDMSRMRMFQDEMKKDHEKEIKSVERKYETQLFDLEDRCSIMTLELERMRKSMLGVEGDFVEERHLLENKIEDLENVRRELEIKCTILEDDISLVKEQSNMREEEAKSILKTAAEKQSEMKSDLLELTERLRTWKVDSESSGESARKEFEGRIEDLSAENKHLKSKLKSFEMNAALDSEMKDQRDQEGGSEDLSVRLQEMKKQMAVLTDENLSLKRRLLGHKSLEKKARLLSGVEDICRPRNEEMALPTQMTLLTSTPCKNETDGHSFSPTAEEVSLIEGFVSENVEKPLSARKLENMYAQKSGDEEPDFVAEESDRFQPEMVIERAMDDFANPHLKPNIHPIRDFVVTEGFQPELSDQFFEEVSEDNGTDWPAELSVGMSPTLRQSSQFQYGKDVIEQIQSQSVIAVTNAPPFEKTSGDEPDGGAQKQNADELEKQVKQIKYDLEEEYMLKLRKQKQDVIIEYEIKQESMEKEMEQHFVQKELSIRNDWETKFAKALKKMKKDFEKKFHKQSSPTQQQQRSPKRKQASEGLEAADVSHKEEGMPKIEEGSEELGDVVEQLSKENQELAEVRDELLKQIELSQARGLHNRVHHELQSKLSGREKESVASPQVDSLTTPAKDVPIEEEFTQTESAELCAGGPESVDLEADSSRTEVSETSSVAAERFLEELEDMSQQASQDLPLEWELTNTIAAEANVAENEVGGQQSIWEVFGSRCGRQDCQEVRHRYRRLCQCVVKSFGIWEDLVSEESGLLAQGGQNDEEDQGEGVSAKVSSLAVAKGDNGEEDDVDDQFADNVALESELLSLAEDMVFHKEAYMKRKCELERENEFLRLELETELSSRKEAEERFVNERDEMVSQIEDLESQVASFKGTCNEMDISIASCNKEVMTDQLSHYDTSLSKLELEENNTMALNLKEKEETISRLSLDMERVKSEFEEMFSQYKLDVESRIKALEDEIDDVKTENSYLCSTHEGKEDTIARLRTEINMLKSEQKDSAETLSEQESKLDDLEKQAASLRDQVSSLRSIVEVKEERISNLSQDLRQVKSEKEDLVKHSSTKDDKLESLEKERDGLKEQNIQLQSAIDVKGEQLANLEGEVSQGKHEQEDVVKRLSEKESKLKTLEEEVVTLKDNICKLKSTLEAKEVQIASLESEVKQGKKAQQKTVKSSSAKDGKLKALEKEAASLKDCNGELKSALEVKDERIASLSSEVKELESQRDDLMKSSSAIDSRMKDLELEVASLEGKNVQLQSVIETKEELLVKLDMEVNQLKSDQVDKAELLSEKDGKIDILGNQMVCMEDEKVSLQSVFGKNTNVCKDLESEVSQLKSEVEDLRQKEDSLNLKDDEKGNIISKLQSQLEDLTQESVSDKNKIKSLEDQVSCLINDSNDLRSGLGVKEETFAKSQVEIGSLRSQLEEASKQSEYEVDSLKSQLDEASKKSESEINSLKSQLEETFKKSESEIGSLKSQLEEASKQSECEVDSLKSQLEEASKKSESQIDSLKSQLEEASKTSESEIDSLKSQLEEASKKSEGEIDSLKSRLEEAFDTVQNLQRDNSRLAMFEDQVGALRDENDTLQSDKTGKVEMIAKLEQEIDQLKTELLECRGRIKELDRQLEEMMRNKQAAVEEFIGGQELTCGEGAEVVSEDGSFHSSENQSSVDGRVIPAESLSLSSDIVKDVEVTQMKACVVGQAQKEPLDDGTDSDRRSGASSQAQADDFIVAEKVDPVTCSVYGSTSSVAGLEESFVSSTSSFNLSPAELQDQALVDELNQLKKDLRETKAIYSKENSLLHEALKREKRVKDFVLSKNDPELDSAAANSEEGPEENEDSETCNLERLEQKLAVCLEQNKMLEEENTKLRTKIRKQEAVVLIYKHRLSEKEHDSEMWRKSLTSQLQALQKQRDDLVHLLRNQETGSSPTISEAMGQAAIKEESLRKVQDDLMEKMEELDHLHQMLTQRQVELQHCDMERRHLEQLCLLKDQTEMQLMKQKRLMEEQVSEIEHRLHERETILKEEKTKLLEELEEKDQILIHMSQPQSPRTLPSMSPSRSYSMGDLRSCSLGGASAGGNLSSSAEHADKQHLKAIEMLREKLRLEYDLRTSRLAESQASAVASYWKRHQSKNDLTEGND